MTVGELIEWLKQQPQDYKVMVVRDCEAFDLVEADLPYGISHDRKEVTL